MAGWNFADAYEAITAAVPQRAALVHGERRVSWSMLDRRAAALAADLAAAGLRRESKVAAYLTNGPEYVETYVAAFKGRFTPLNVNYRYGPGEISYLLQNSDAEAVVFHTSFAALLDDVRATLPMVKRWYAVRDGTDPVPLWAVAYEDVVTTGDAVADGPASRSGDDVLLLYTGGTTGLPKGVIWRQDDLFRAIGGGGNPLLGIPVPETTAEFQERLQAADPHGPVMLITCPLMHGTGQFSALSALTMAGTVVTLPGRFDAGDIWSSASRNRANAIVIVGQTFGGPLLDDLVANGKRYDLSALRLITSSGVMWSQENKDALLERLPHVALLDNYGASEAVGAGASLSRPGRARSTGRFRLGKRSAVFTEDGRRIEPGSGERGLVAMTGPLPLGYYKDEEKTRATFRMFEGRRWSVLGDWAEVDADGTIRLLGRGSSCVNTGGEKVFPEEVEEVLKLHPAVRDAVIVGVPDDRFGEAVCAIVASVDGEPIEPAALAAHVKANLAAFKAPRHVVVVDAVDRAPNGKVDHRAMRALALERLGLGRGDREKEHR